MQVYTGKVLYYIVDEEIYEDEITGLSSNYFWFNDYVVDRRNPDRTYFETIQEALAELKKQKTAYAVSN